MVSIVLKFVRGTTVKSSMPYSKKRRVVIGVTSSNVRFDAKGGIVAYVCACTLRSAYAGDSSLCCELFV